MRRRRFEVLCDGVFRFPGGVQVYAIPTRGGGCALIDLGDGEALDHLGEIGCKRVTDVLVTHGHRTQIEGVGRLVGTDTRLHVNPAAAVFQPDSMEGCLSQLVPMRSKADGRVELPMPLPGGVETVRDLVPGSTLSVGGIELETLDAAGHDIEQVAFVGQIGGRRVCFAGDAIYSPGKIYELFATDWDHYTSTGARAAADALATIRAAAPDVVLTSHGPGVLEDVADSLLITEGLLRAYAGYKEHFFLGQSRGVDLKQGRPRPFGEDGPCRISEHVWALSGNTYVITSDEAPGACLMLDACAGAAERAVEEMAQIGACLNAGRPLKPEIILGTHFHSDHIPLAADMGTHYAGAELWAEEHVAYVAENCERVRRPWLAPTGVGCARHLKHGETFQWRGHAFAAHWMPGQTDAHAGYSACIDGHRILFTGDNFYFPQKWGGYGGICGLNGAWDPLTGYKNSAQQVLDLDPEWLLMEHGMASVLVRDWFEYALEWSDEVALLQQALSPGGDRARHCNPHLIAFEPFVMPIRSGQAQPVRVQLDNRGASRQRHVLLEACPPPGVQVRPARLELVAAPDGVSSGDGELTCADDAHTGDPLTLVPVRVTIDGESLGHRNAVFLDRRL